MENSEIRTVMVSHLQSAKNILKYEPKGSIGIRLLNREIEAYEQVIKLLDLAEQGKLVKLPCRTDDTIYQLRGKRHIKGAGISPRIVSCVTVWSNGRYELKHQGSTPCRESDLGKTWFLTKDAAEARLAGLEGAE